MVLCLPSPNLMFAIINFMLTSWSRGIIIWLIPIVTKVYPSCIVMVAIIILLCRCFLVAVRGSFILLALTSQVITSLENMCYGACSLFKYVSSPTSELSKTLSWTGGGLPAPEVPGCGLDGKSVLLLVKSVDLFWVGCLRRGACSISSSELKSCFLLHQWTSIYWHMTLTLCLNQIGSLLLTPLTPLGLHTQWQIYSFQHWELCDICHDTCTVWATHCFWP